jgi:hypothetical protein
VSLSRKRPKSVSKCERGREQGLKGWPIGLGQPRDDKGDGK